MSNPPNFAPILGHRVGDWLGESASGLLHWAYSPEECNESVTTGELIDPGLEYALVQPTSSATVYYLPSSQEFKVGGTLRLYFESEAKLRSSDAASQINGKATNTANQVTVSGKTFLECTLVNKEVWHVRGWTSLGAATTITPAAV